MKKDQSTRKAETSLFLPALFFAVAAVTAGTLLSAAIPRARAKESVELHKLAPAVSRTTQASFQRGKQVMAFYDQHRDAWKRWAGWMLIEGESHDGIELSKLDHHEKVDENLSKKIEHTLLSDLPRSEPKMMAYGPYTGQVFHELYEILDWTHLHQRDTYNILSLKDESSKDMKKELDDSVAFYLEHSENALSPAPVDLVLRRTAAIAKPYFGYLRDFYPHISGDVNAGSWWFSAIESSLLLQHKASPTDQLLKDVLKDPPQRLLLTREVAPDFARLDPKTANVLDNLHVLHHLVYDILSYSPWSDHQKRAEINRLIETMKARPGDDQLARKFEENTPTHDPTKYAASMKFCDGAMTTMTLQMVDEILPLLSQEKISTEKRQELYSMLMKGICPPPGSTTKKESLLDRIQDTLGKKLKVKGADEPGKTPISLEQAMVSNWTIRSGQQPDIAPYSPSESKQR